MKSRVTMKRSQTPNKIIREWLLELLKEAKGKQCKYESKIREALSSLAKFPLDIQSGAECSILKGFDKPLCDFIDERMNIYKRYATNGGIIKNDRRWAIISKTPIYRGYSILQFIEILSSHSSILLSLLKFALCGRHEVPCDIIEKNSIKTLRRIISSLQRYRLNMDTFNLQNFLTLQGLFRLNVRQDHFALSAFGISEARHLHRLLIRRKRINVRTQTEQFVPLKTYDEPESPNYLNPMVQSENAPIDLVSMTDDSDNGVLQEKLFYIDLTKPVDQCGSLQFELDTENTCIQNVLFQNEESSGIILEPGSFDVTLLIDKHESWSSGSEHRNASSSSESPNTIEKEFRSLKIGDFLWVARCRSEPQNELVLPYIVERKRLDDFCSSIQDGRFHEQKFRLRRCGLKNVIYMVEKCNAKNLSLPMNTLKQAMQNIRVHDGFKVCVTNSKTHSLQFLETMTKKITEKYKDMALTGMSGEISGNMLMTFVYFNESSAKNKLLTVTETFIKLLLQMRGLSVDKALAIAEIYPTPKSLISAYDGLDPKEGEMLLSKLKFGKQKRNVGPAISKSIYQLFTSRTLK